MENATKALIMVAGVFIGMMILSLGIHLYLSLGSYVEDTNELIAENSLNAFNTQFLNYINYINDSTELFELKIQDIITVAGIAYENNKKNEGTSSYVTVNVTGINNLEQKINNISSQLLSDNMIVNSKYKCTNKDVKINQTTGRVYEINFTKIVN